jgi:DOPA 4,5-dioxygenase|tara:strand:- start:2019 stop:2411 length:393 start_codon:yes stop_codon:yes gene_type:complete
MSQQVPSASPQPADSTPANLETAIRGYHAHIYFNQASKAAAWALKEEVGRRFTVSLGRFHERLVGPHPQWSIQIAFAAPVFSELVPWLMLNRQGLTIFIHPETGRDLADHSDHVLWLGPSDQLNIEMFKS